MCGSFPVGLLVDVTGSLLDPGLCGCGAPAFGGVRIPGAVAHIEIGLEVNTWRSGPESGAGLRGGPAC